MPCTDHTNRITTEIKLKKIFLTGGGQNIPNSQILYSHLRKAEMQPGTPRNKYQNVYEMAIKNCN